MCLVIKKNSKELTAKKDIVVYKHIILRENGTYETSYQYVNIEIGQTYTRSEEHTSELQSR
jgi:hypothetical protein